MDDDPFIIAYQIYDHVTIGLQPAPIERDWMDSAHQRHPYRCLPLNIANQNGWVLSCPTDFRVYWYGGPNPSDLEVRFDGTVDPCVSSHFGSGVLTFSLPYLFRTPPGINLWVKGPANWVKDGIQPLEGVVESDWLVSTFTMNWKITRMCEWIRFEEGEPFCMLVPVPRGLVESLVPKRVPIVADPDTEKGYRAWEKSRAVFLKGLNTRDPEAVKLGWQKDYFRGVRPDGSAHFDDHQTHLSVREFTREPWPPAPASGGPPPQPSPGGGEPGTH